MTPDPRRTPVLGSSVGQFLTLGIQLALAVLVFFFLGRWLDEKFATTPWLMITGLFVGVTGGLISFLRSAMRIGDEQDREDRGNRTNRDDGDQK
jgi:F0F1-type ATP synthase assembly protein I